MNNLQANFPRSPASKTGCFLPVFGPFFAFFGEKYPFFASNHRLALRVRVMQYGL
jgi:hypothetical protein